MPMSNMKYRLRVQDKYKHWFPLEDPTPYWEEVSLKLQNWYRSIIWDKDKKHNPQLVLDILIFALEKSIEFNNSVHTPADFHPAFYFLSSLTDLSFLLDEVKYYRVLAHLLPNLYDNTVFQKNLLVILVNMKNGSYIPMDEFSKKRIQKEYYNYVRSYDPTLESYHIYFS
jgi:hypothetical protein